MRARFHTADGFSSPCDESNRQAISCLPFTDQEVAARPLALQDEPLQGEHLQQEALEDGVDGDEIVDIDYDRSEKEFGELLEESLHRLAEPIEVSDADSDSVAEPPADVASNTEGKHKTTTAKHV